MSDTVVSAEFDGQAMKRVYENRAWTVGIKNYRPGESLGGVETLGRHHETDELFVLLAGACFIVAMVERGGRRKYSATAMRSGSVYTVPRGLWHVTITEPGSKLLIVEDSSTGPANSDVMAVNESDRSAIRAAVAAERRRAASGAPSTARPGRA